MSLPTLPTIKECHQFMEAINAGRQAMDFEPLSKLDYDECKPGSSQNCLSAHHLFSLADRKPSMTLRSEVRGIPAETNNKLALALGTTTGRRGRRTILIIPASIKCVTDYFDSTLVDTEDWRRLRDRLVEAGLVEPEPETAF